MNTVQTEASALIDAKPEQVYAVLSDYQTHHANILPKQYFTHYEVESGGQGAGTVFRATVTVMGVQSHFHMAVSEPQPGQVIAESDLENGTVTTFMLMPAQGGAQTQVTISTAWTPKPGIAGWLERLFNPMTLRQIYNTELAQLNSYVRSLGS
jgi:Polyketide cyclase / dehydrase and lipid transport